MRTITFENSYAPDELAKALIDAGFGSGDRLGNIAGGSVNCESYIDADDDVSLDCVVDEDDVLDALGDEAILKAAADMAVDGAKARDIEDGILYARSGELALARAMFARVFDGADLQAAERALS